MWSLPTSILSRNTPNFCMPLTGFSRVGPLISSLYAYPAWTKRRDGLIDFLFVLSPVKVKERKKKQERRAKIENYQKFQFTHIDQAKMSQCQT